MASHGVRATKCASSSTALPIAISPLSSPNVLGGTAGGESSRPVGGLADRLAEEQRELGEAGFDLVGNLLGLGGRALVGILDRCLRRVEQRAEQEHLVEVLRERAAQLGGARWRPSWGWGPGGRDAPPKLTRR